MNVRIIPALIIFAIACGKKDTRGEQGLTDQTQVEAPTQQVHADPGPRVERKTGAREFSVREPTTAQVDRIEEVDGVFHVVVPLSTTDVPALNQQMLWHVDAKGVHASAFGWTGTHRTDAQRSQAAVIVRFAEQPPREFTIRWAQQDGQSWGARRIPGVLGSIEVAVPDDAKRVTGLEQQYWSEAERAFSHGGGGAFSAWAHARSAHLAGRAASAAPSGGDRRRRSNVHRMMDLYSGMTSVNEALQSDRGLLLRAEPPDARTIPIGDVERLAMPVHPWPRMISELGKKPKVEPLAAYVPADMAYLHFQDLRTLLKLASDLDDWVSPVAQWVEDRPGVSHFVAGYEEQLVLERTGIAQKLGHVAAKGVAVVVSDPFLREGTDVSMIFHVANRAALISALSAFEANARARHPTMASESLAIGNTPVRRLFTLDGRVNQYRVEYGEVLVISNSRGALEHLLAAHQGKAPRLAEQGDFRYMRAVYPWVPAEEDGFVFLSDAFVARVVSPEVKILEARRMEARADLLSINHAALLRGWADGVTTADIGELVKARYVGESELRHADGATIAFATDTGATSSWGSVSRITPIRDLAIDNVSPEEMSAYDQFRRTYESYWRGYIDPIGARIERSDDGSLISIDARMLPLIDVSEYDELIREVGLQKVRPASQGPGLEWTLAIGREARLRKKLDGLARGFFSRGGDDIGLGWLGEWVSFGVADRSGLWDMALLTYMIPSHNDEFDVSWLTGLEALPTFPLYGVADVASKVGLAALLTGLKAWVHDAAPGMVQWSQGEPYRDIPIVTVGGGEEIAGEFGDLAVHYATVGDLFVISFERATLLGLIDRYLAGAAPQASTGPPSGAADEDAQAILSVDPTGEWLATTLLGMAESVLISRHTDITHDYELLWRGFGSRTLSPDDVRRLGVAYLGREPRSPHGGTFSIVDGFPTHSIYGDSVRPVMPDVPIADSPISQTLLRLGQLSMSVEFEGEGDHRGLHSRVSWRWKQ